MTTHVGEERLEMGSGEAVSHDLPVLLHAAWRNHWEDELYARKVQMQAI